MARRLIPTLILLALLSACGEEECDSAVQQATLSALRKADLYPGGMSGCGWLKECSSGDFNEAVFRSYEIRLFASTVSPGCVKNSYLRWADFLDREIENGKRETRTREKQNAHQEWERKEKMIQERADGIGRFMPKPEKARRFLSRDDH